MTIIQGGPKPVVSVPIEPVTSVIRPDVIQTPVRAVAKSEATAHYARDTNRDANVDDVRGRRVDTVA